MFKTSQAVCRSSAIWKNHPTIGLGQDGEIKGTVQRKLTGVLSGINRKRMTSLRSLKSKNVISALTGTLL
jgi:hypothetical protein